MGCPFSIQVLFVFMTRRRGANVIKVIIFLVYMRVYQDYFDGLMPIVLFYLQPFNTRSLSVAMNILWSNEPEFFQLL